MDQTLMKDRDSDHKQVTATQALTTFVCVLFLVAVLGASYLDQMVRQSGCGQHTTESLRNECYRTLGISK